MEERAYAKKKMTESINVLHAGTGFRLPEKWRYAVNIL